MDAHGSLVLRCEAGQCSHFRDYRRAPGLSNRLNCALDCDVDVCELWGDRLIICDYFRGERVADGHAGFDDILL